MCPCLFLFVIFNGLTGATDNTSLTKQRRAISPASALYVQWYRVSSEPLIMLISGLLNFYVNHVMLWELNLNKNYRLFATWTIILLLFKAMLKLGTMYVLKIYGGQHTIIHDVVGECFSFGGVGQWAYHRSQMNGSGRWRFTCRSQCASMLHVSRPQVLSSLFFFSHVCMQMSRQSHVLFTLCMYLNNSLLVLYEGLKRNQVYLHRMPRVLYNDMQKLKQNNYAYSGIDPYV